MGRSAILIGALLSLTAWSAQAATNSTQVEVRLVIVDTCRTATPSAAHNDTQVACSGGTPYRVQRSEASSEAPVQSQSTATATTRTVTVTY